MVDYSFNVKSMEDITLNKKFVNACLDSVRAGDPIQFEIKSDYTLTTRSISCLDYILDAYGDTSEYVDVGLFDELADPSIDLNNEYCSMFNPENRTATATTCIPKIITAYSSMSRRGNIGSGKKTLMNSMEKIVNKYHDQIRSDNCRILGSGTCMERLFRECDDIKFIKLQNLPEGFFNTPMCHLSSRSRQNNEHTPLYNCLRPIIDASIASDPNTNTAKNAMYLLTEMIKSKQYENQLYVDENVCPASDEPYRRTCFSYILEKLDKRGIYETINTVIDLYSKDDVIDITSENSPFSGAKCSFGDHVGAPVGCLDVVTDNVVANLISYNTSYVELCERPLKMISRQPRFDGVCGSVDFISVLASSYYNHLTSVNPNRLKDVVAKFDNGVMLDGELVANPFVMNSQDNDVNLMESRFNKLNLIDCISKVTGVDRTVTAFDYTLERESVVKLSMDVFSNEKLLIPFLSQSECKSLKSDKMVLFLDKLGTDMILNPSTTVSGLDTIQYIFDSSANNYLYYPVMYPENGIYFVNKVIDSLQEIISTGSYKENRVLRSNMQSTLEMILRNVDTYTRGSDITIPEEKKPSLSKFLNVYKTLETSFSFENRGDPARAINMVNTLINQFSYKPEDIPNLVRMKLVSALKFDHFVKLLGKWGELYKDIPSVQDSIDYQLNSYRGDLYEEDPSKPENDNLLFNFFKMYMRYLHEFNRDSDNDSKYELPNNVKDLFKSLYGIPMEEYFKPSKETRLLYDKMCFIHPGYNGSGVDNGYFMTNIYNNLEDKSKLQYDNMDITGVYDITTGQSGGWGDNHILRYVNVMSFLIWGSGSGEVIGKPYVKWEKSQHTVPVGLVDAINRVSEIEFVGNRSKNIKGRLRMVTSDFPSPRFLSNYNNQSIVQEFKKTGDVIAKLEYVDEIGHVLQDAPQTSFYMLDAMQKIPKKLKKKLQEQFPILFGQLDAVIAFERSPEGEEDTAGKTYKLTISNKPVDILRSATCHQFDGTSCMTLFGGGHNESLQSYIDNGSYIAYLTKNSEYEPQWMARLLMHRCGNCNKCVSIQESHRYYEIDNRTKLFPHWNLLHDAVKTILADKGVNNTGRYECEFAWGGGISREDIEDNGDSRCDDEMNERTNECIGECGDNCDEHDYFDDISDQIGEEVESRLQDELKDHTDDEGDYDISDHEIDNMRDRISDEVLNDDFTSDLIDERKDNCRDECDGNCEDVNSDFDCYGWLSDNGMLDEEMEVWTDDSYIQKLIKGDTNYTDILLERTGQKEESSKFVKQVAMVF